MCYILVCCQLSVLSGIKKAFEDVHLNVEIYWISIATLWNSMTVITLLHALKCGFRNTQEKQEFKTLWSALENLHTVEIYNNSAA